MPYGDMTGPYGQGPYTGRMGAYAAIPFHPQEIYGTPQSRMFGRGQYISLVPYIQEQAQYLPQWYQMRREYELEKERQRIEQENLREMEKQAEYARRIELANLGIRGTQTAAELGIPQWGYRKLFPESSYYTPGLQDTALRTTTQIGLRPEVTTRALPELGQFGAQTPTMPPAQTFSTMPTGPRSAIPITAKTGTAPSAIPPRGFLGRGKFMGTGMSPLEFGTTALSGFGYGQQYGEKLDKYLPGGGDVGKYVGGAAAGALGAAGIGGIGTGLSALGIGIGTGGLGLIPILTSSIFGGLGAAAKEHEWGRKISRWWKKATGRD